MVITKDGLPRQVWLSLSQFLSSFKVPHLRFPQVNHITSHPSAAWTHPSPELTQQNFRSILCQKNWLQQSVLKGWSHYTENTNWHFLSQNLPVFKLEEKYKNLPSPQGLILVCVIFFLSYLPYRKDHERCTSIDNLLPTHTPLSAYEKISSYT